MKAKDLMEKLYNLQSKGVDLEKLDVITSQMEFDPKNFKYITSRLFIIQDDSLNGFLVLQQDDEE